MNGERLHSSSDVVKVALTATLCDLGKVPQRAGVLGGTHDDIGVHLIDELSSLFPHGWLDDMCDAVGSHHRGESKKGIAKAVRIAGKLSCTETRPERGPYPAISVNSPLQPILSKAKLKHGAAPDPSGYRLQKLTLGSEGGQGQSIFPVSRPPTVEVEDYERLWSDFRKDALALATSGQIDSYPRLVSWLCLLRKYLTSVPAAIPGEADEQYFAFPDTSLYDHVKVTAALATCLMRLEPESLDLLEHRAGPSTTIARLVRGDFSGIQDFIYRVAKPRSDTSYRGVGQRLRGRSFHIALIGEVVADWLVRQAGLTVANILYVGGGRFDLLLAIDSNNDQKTLKNIDEIKGWMLRSFHGELGLEMATEDLRFNDLANMSSAYSSLDAKLAELKQRKWLSSIADISFFEPPGDWHHACPSCHSSPVPDSDKLCGQCEDHKSIGQTVPRMTQIAWTYDEAKPTVGLSIPFGPPFGMNVSLLKEGEGAAFLSQLGRNANDTILYCVNSTDFIPTQATPGIGLGFRFLAKHVPHALKQIKLRHREEFTEPDDILDFEEIAELSRGAKYLGVLKADVDHLGLIFGLGFHPLSLPRLSSLSQSVDLFFSGWVNRLCDRLFEAWKQQSDNKHDWRDKVSGLFYVSYSGGDDLLIIGPWDQTLELAVEQWRSF